MWKLFSSSSCRWSCIPTDPCFCYLHTILGESWKYKNKLPILFILIVLLHLKDSPVRNVTGDILIVLPSQLTSQRRFVCTFWILQVSNKKKLWKISTQKHQEYSYFHQHSFLFLTEMCPSLRKERENRIVSTFRRRCVWQYLVGVKSLISCICKFPNNRTIQSRVISTSQHARLNFEKFFISSLISERKCNQRNHESHSSPPSSWQQEAPVSETELLVIISLFYLRHNDGNGRSRVQLLCWRSTQLTEKADPWWPSICNRSNSIGGCFSILENNN